MYDGGPVPLIYAVHINLSLVYNITNFPPRKNDSFVQLVIASDVTIKNNVCSSTYIYLPKLSCGNESPEIRAKFIITHV